VTSEQVNKAIQEVEKLAQKQIQEKALPGLAIAVVFQDKVVYAKGFGVRDVNTKAPVDADTVFQLASMSKPIGSTVVADLVGEGKIKEDQPILGRLSVQRQIQKCRPQCEKDNGLAIVQGPKNRTFPMKHYDRDAFTYETEDENAVGRSGITFTIGPDGKATQVVVENLNARGEGTFKRVPNQK
jgi:hypothetical protein